MIIIFSFFVVYFSYNFFASPSTAIEWQKISTIEKVKVPTNAFRVGLFDFSYEFDNYVITELYRGSDVQPYGLAAAIQLFAVGISLIILLVVISALEGFWFYFGALAISGILISFKLEQLLWFGQADKTALIVSLAIFLGSLFYFNQIRPGHGILIRLLSFTVLTLALGALLFFFSEISSPLLNLVNYGLIAPLILSVVFIILLGHVLISFFLKITTQGNAIGNKNSVWHFLTISLIYLINVVLLYAKNAGYIDWDILYVNAYVILIIVAILGIWDFKDREIQYQGMTSFAPLGAMLYMALAIICFSTLSYIFAIANDPLIETFEDTIVFSQMGFGGLFMLYIIANFINPLMENLQVYKIMYKPPTFPYGTVQIVGLIAMIAFFLNANMFPLQQAVAGYYNGIGDVYQQRDDQFVAEQYYKLGDQYGYNNHRSNYSLGTLARSQGDASLAPFYFSEALKKKPTSYAQVNLGYELLNSDQFFDALFSFRRGLDKFKADPYLYNNLAVAYGKTSLLDSALHFLTLANASELTRQAAETNMLGLIAKNESLLSFDLDSLFDEVVSDKAYMPSLVNTFMLANKYATNNQPLEDEDIRWLDAEDSVLNSFEFAYAFNYAYNRPQEIDSVQLRQLAHFPEVLANGNHFEPLLLIQAYVLYKQNRVDDAMRILDRLQALNPFNRAYYNNVLGVWALEQNAPRVASQYFENAEKSRFEDALFRKAVSLTEASPHSAELKQQAQAAWDSLYRLSEEGISEMNPVVETIRQIINDNGMAWEGKDDAYKYQLLRYRFIEFSEAEFQKIFASLEDPNYKILLLHDLWQKYPDQLNTYQANSEQLLQNTGQLNELGQQYHEWLNAFLLEKNQSWDKLSEVVGQLAVISQWHQQMLWYYQARLAEKNKDTHELQQISAKLLGNPFFVRGFLFAVNQMEVEDPLGRYNLLLEALETNPYAPALHQAYIATSLEAGLENYAESGLDELRPLLPSLGFQEYLLTYDSLKAKYTPAF
ncbi:hypothetical protein [Catalinimonas niigatensis]|uniref:hypothetical protein n=1 Tax=Catalinimonas niigatensis TaxID=1397264 RepID=UPI0026654D20|nr:hypothetical protein [Catalinimonas niigatensis]WPP50654.1 hypothetical protein PZB72_28745 [Catalinimonas niigatensis]